VDEGDHWAGSLVHDLLDHLQRMLGAFAEADKGDVRPFPRRHCSHVLHLDLIVLRRFTEYHDLESAFGRRAVTERAKGILMERHSIDEPAAFELLREQTRSTNRKLVDVASAVVDGHRLLPKQPAPAPP